MHRFILPALAALVLAHSAVQAEVFTWISTASGTWTNPANWQSVSGSYPQQPGDVAAFTNIMETTAALDVTLPAGVVTCGVVTCAHITNTYRINGAGVNASFLVLTNIADTARIELTGQRASGGASFVFRNCTIVMPHHTLIAAPFYASGITFENTSAWEGNAVVTTRSHMTEMYLLVQAPSPNFKGTVVVAERDLFMRATAALTNAQLIQTVRNTTAYINNRESTTRFPLKLENGTRYRLTSNGANAHEGALLIEGVVTVQADNTLTLSGAASGTGTVTKTGNGAARFTGSITPGASAGILRFTRSAGTLLLGIAGDPVDLNIEVTGAGGVPGTDHSQIIIASLDTALDLANINLAFTGVASGMVTNWFLVGNNIDVSSDFAAVDYGPGKTGEIVKEDNFDGSNDRVGALVIPEPSLALAGLALLLGRRRG